MQAPEFLSLHASHVDEALAKMLDSRSNVVVERLLLAMHYSLLAGGKRIRPALLLECYRASGGKDIDSIMSAALAIECMHTYSLIHDDLPCMDDDDLRRGKPTCHKQFDEATAVLAADALQTLAFELLADLKVSSEVRIELIQKLAIASGCQGMVGGQMMDMLAVSIACNDDITDVLAVERIHVHKTGALLCWCCEAGALLAAAGEAERKACARYGKAVGLLFQIADDILDATASSKDLGKSSGKDEAQNKATYVSILGLQRSRELADEMRDLAMDACQPLGQQAETLLTLADYILERGQ
jgi:geranylgeranyl pyrophosphate synthase